VIMTGQVSVNNGDPSNFMVVRMNADGSLDDNFGTDGVVTTGFGSSGYGYPFSVSLQTDGKIIVGGRVNNDGADVLAAVRYFSSTSTGILDLSSDSTEVMIYPNPISGATTLTYSMRNVDTISIRLIDATGRIVQSILNNESQTQGNHQIDIALDEEVSSGIYFLIISSTTFSESIRLIKE